MVFTVMIIAVVYLPLPSLDGGKGKVFCPMALIRIFALLASLMLVSVSMTLR